MHVFPRYIAWIDQATFVPLQAKIYNKDNKLQKVMVAGNIKRVGSIHLPFTTVAKDLLREHTTILNVKEAKADTRPGRHPLSIKTRWAPPGKRIFKELLMGDGSVGRH